MLHPRKSLLALAMILIVTRGTFAQPSVQVPPPLPAGELVPTPLAPVEPAPVLEPTLREASLSGWFTKLELGLAFSRITQFSEFPKTGLDAAVVPDLHLGYRFASGSAVQFGWRYLDTAGDGSVTDPDLGPLHVHSRLENVVVDFDYVSPYYDSATEWSFQWLAGLRGDSMLIRSRLRQGKLEIVGDNEFGGLGGHLNLGVARTLGASGWVLYGRLDGGIIFGGGRQHVNISNGLHFDGFETHGPETVPMLHVQAGFSWSPPNNPWFRFATGYQYEQWWLRADGQDADNAFFNHLGYLSHGPFIRCEIGY